jgi:integrase
MAYEDNYLSQSFKGRIGWIEEEEAMKNFLTIDECRTLFTTELSDDTLRKYYMFAFLTGLRYSDINNLTWEDVVVRDKVSYIYFRMQKTSAFQYHPISEEAVNLMGERTKQICF